MYLDLEQLQGKPWHEVIAILVKSACRVAHQYQNPLLNDAGGTIDCYKLEDKLEDCNRILKRYEEKEQ